MENLKVAGVVILYNPTDEDINNINTYIDDIDILYVMDNSSKENKARLPKNKKINYIFNNENLGIAKPLNEASEMAREKGYKWILTMDQDTKFKKNIIPKIKEKIINTDCSNIGIITPWHKTKLKTIKPKEKIDYPLDVMTSGNFVNLDIHKKINGFKEWLFIDGVDIEYCLNLKKNNYQVMRLNELEIEHNLGNIFYKKFFNKDLLVTNHSAMRRYYQCRNYLYIRDMYIDEEPKFCKILVKFKTIILAIILYENDKFNKLKSFFKGYKDYKLGKRGRTYEKNNK